MFYLSLSSFVSDSNIKLVHVLEHKRLRGTWLPFPTKSLPCHISALQKCATWHKWQSGEFCVTLEQHKVLILSLLRKVLVVPKQESAVQKVFVFSCKLSFFVHHVLTTLFLGGGNFVFAFQFMR